MEIVLTQFVDALGSAGQIVRVNPGYARNYLFPKHLAMPATTANLRIVADHAGREEVRESKIRGKLEKVAAKLAKVSLTTTVKVGEDDKVFGSVTSLVITELLKEQGFEFERKNIKLEEPIKALGQYDVAVNLGYGVSGTVKVYVVRE